MATEQRMGEEAEILERELERLAEVRAARVVAAPSGRILEIHLVTDGSKPPKQLTRDVETVAATQGIDIDRRTISIAQMPDVAQKDAIAGPGLTLGSLSVAIEGTQATARVRVKLHDEEGIGEVTAAATTRGRDRLIASATLDAVSSLKAGKVPADVDRVVTDGDVVVAVLMFAPDIMVPGVAVGHGDEAVARAVLDAVNRS